MNDANVDVGPLPAWLILKNKLDALDEGTPPSLEQEFPPLGAPLFWEDFKAWVAANMRHLSLAVQDEQLVDVTVSQCLRCYRAGRMDERDAIASRER